LAIKNRKSDFNVDELKKTIVAKLNSQDNQ